MHGKHSIKKISFTIQGISFNMTLRTVAVPANAGFSDMRVTVGTKRCVYTVATNKHPVGQPTYIANEDKHKTSFPWEIQEKRARNEGIHVNKDNDYIGCQYSSRANLNKTPIRHLNFWYSIL
jgi:hypothetical protein